MFRSVAFLISLAAASATAFAQSASPADPVSPASSQPAPIVRAYAGAPGANGSVAGPGASAPRSIVNSQPMQGVLLRVEPGTSVQTVSSDTKGLELRLEHGRANVNVHNPAANSQILIDLPSGQTSLLKNGLYTFNADTNTVRVLKGEAETYPTGAAANDKPIKVKEDHQLALTATKPGSVEVGPNQLFADVLPAGNGEPRDNGSGYYPGARYGSAFYGPYGDGLYGPYAYGYPYGYGFGYPYGYGFGLGFGYYGGFRGGYGGFGGFRGRR